MCMTIILKSNKFNTPMKSHPPQLQRAVIDGMTTLIEHNHAGLARLQGETMSMAMLRHLTSVHQDVPLATEARVSLLRAMRAYIQSSLAPSLLRLQDADSGIDQMAAVVSACLKEHAAGANSKSFIL